MSADHIEDIKGVVVNTLTKMVVNGTKPVKERVYYGSRISDDVVCFKDGRYCNVELFQPVIYDREQFIPKFDDAWIEWTNPTAKNKRIVRINFPHSYIQYWKEQRRRCIHGYTVGGVHLTGEFYFYLNFWRIRGKKKGEGLISPRFFDLQKELFDLVDQARREGKNLLTLKRRQIGFSECYAALIAHEYTFYKQSRGLIVGGEDKYATITMNKVLTGLNAFHPSSSNAGREFYKPRKSGVDREDMFECGRLDKTGAAIGYLSQVASVTTQDNVQAVNGQTPTFALLEEAGINAYVDIVYEMILPAMREQGNQDGRIIVINGTGGDMDAGAARLMEMFYNPEKYNILVSSESYEPGISGTAHFFPAWKWHVMDHDGNSYREQGMVLIERERATKKGANLTTFKTQMPMTPSEAFIVSGQCPFNVTKLEMQKGVLMEMGQKDYMQWGRFEWIFEGVDKDNIKSMLGKQRKVLGVEWVPCPMGKENEVDGDGDKLYPVCIIEHPERPTTKEGEEGFKYLFHEPRYEGLYKAGMDPYNKEEASKTAYSFGSTTIAKGYLNGNSSYFHFPASLTWRPTKKDKFYEMSVKMQCYYGMCRVLIEWSNDAPLDWYKNNGWEFLLKERPIITHAEMINSQTVNRYGIDPATKYVWEEHYAQYIEDNYFRMTDPHQVDRALAYRKSKKYNCDKTISCMLAWEHVLDDAHIGMTVRDTAAKKKQPFMVGYTNAGGRLRAI